MHTLLFEPRMRDSRVGCPTGDAVRVVDGNTIDVRNGDIVVVGTAMLPPPQAQHASSAVMPLSLV